VPHGEAHRRGGKKQHRDQQLLETLLTEQDKPKLRPPRCANIQDEDDVENYLSLFEQHMETFGVPQESSWMTHLRPLLSGQALSAFQTIPWGEVNNYQTVKAALLQRFGLDQKVYHRRWWQMARKDKESYVCTICLQIDQLDGRICRGM
jgi:hypothetical protein